MSNQIVCVRFPHFSAEVARQSAGIAADIPLVLSAPGGRKVRAACGKAAKRGLYPGVSLRHVRALCPDAQIVMVDESCEQETIERLLSILAEFTPLVEPPTPAPARPRKNQLRTLDNQQSAFFYIDLERLAHAEAVGLARQMGSTIRESIGLTAGIGLAANKFTAYAAAVCTQHGHALPILAGNEAAFLSPLSVTLLPMTEDIAWRLHLLGLTTLGNFATLPASAVLTQFGRDGLFIHGLTNGQDYRRVLPYRPRLVERITRDFEDALADRTVLEAIACSAAIELAVRLQAKGCMGRTLTVRLRLENNTLRESRITLRQPISGTANLIRMVQARLSQVRTGRSGVVALEILLSDLIPYAGQQLDLFAHNIGGRERLQKSLGALTHRYGADRFFWIESAERESPLLERRFRVQGVQVGERL